jgi:hypothetical protein
MFDLYTALVPFYGLLTLANLYFLKSAVSDNATQLEVAEKAISS